MKIPPFDYLWTVLVTIVTGISGYIYKKKIDKVDFRKFILDIEAGKKNAIQTLSTIKVCDATNIAYTGERDLLKLKDPLADMQNNIKYKLDAKLSDQLLSLSRMIQEHNREMERFAGAFGADSYRSILITRLKSIIIAYDHIIDFLNAISC